MAEPPTENDLKQRGTELDGRIAATRARLPENRGPSDPTQGARGMAQGFRIASDFLSAVLVGIAIGYGIDSVFDTSPFGLVAFVLLGFAAGVLNVVRATARTPGEGGPSA